MSRRPPHHRQPQGRAVAGAVIVAGVAASVGLLLAVDAPDLRVLAAAAQAAASCVVAPAATAVF